MPSQQWTLSNTVPGQKTTIFSANDQAYATVIGQNDSINLTLANGTASQLFTLEVNGDGYVIYSAQYSGLCVADANNNPATSGDLITLQQPGYGINIFQILPA